MTYLEIESKLNSARKIFSGTYIAYYVLRCLIHIGFPVMFFAFSPFNDFIGNTTNFFVNSTSSTVSYDRMFYMYILFMNVFIGIIEIFNIFVCGVKTSKTKAILASASCLYSLLVAFFYLILYYSMLNYDGNDLQFFQFVGFSEIFTVIFWIFLIGMFIGEALLSRSLYIYREAKGTLIDALDEQI